MRISDWSSDVCSSDLDILAEEDSLAENAERVNLHPLDQFRAMQAMTDKGEPVEDIAAHFFVTPAVVRQRLKLASVRSEERRVGKECVSTCRSGWSPYH